MNYRFPGLDIGKLDKPLRLSELKKLVLNLGIDCVSYGFERTIDRLCSIKRIQEFGLYYLTSEVDIELCSSIRNSIIISNQIIPDLADHNSFLLVEEPQLTYYKLSNELLKKSQKYHIHPSAIIDDEAEIDENVHIGPYCVIGKCQIKKGVHIHSNVVIYDNCVINNNVIIEPGSVIGATGIAWVWDKTGERIIQPQTGGVLIENDCFIGTNVTIVRGSVNEFTHIGEKTLIAHGTKIGHGVKIGSYCHIANNVTIAGSAVIGERCFLGAACVISSNVKIAHGIIVGAGAVVVDNFDESSIVVTGVPARRKGPVSSHKGVPRALNLRNTCGEGSDKCERDRNCDFGVKREKSQ